MWRREGGYEKLTAIYMASVTSQNLYNILEEPSRWASEESASRVGHSICNMSHTYVLLDITVCDLTDLACIK